MRKLVLGLLMIILALTACDVEMVQPGQSVNQYSLPYLEFVINEFADSFSARVVEGSRLETVYIPSSILINGTVFPVTEFLGFKNPEDAVNLKTIMLEEDSIVISSLALVNVGDEINIGVEKKEEASKWGALPVLERPGMDFLGWFYAGAETPVQEGDAVEGQVSPRWKAHEAHYVAAKASTCEGEGNVEYYWCPNCNRYFKDEACTQELGFVTLPAKGHVLQLVKAVEATCEKSGVLEHYKCSACGALFWDKARTRKASAQEVVDPALTHSWKYSLVKSETVCYCYVCERCSATKDSAAHSWDEGALVKEATATQCGEKLFTCTRCGVTKKEYVDPSDPSHVHSWTDVGKPVAKSCTTDGYTLRKCQGCGLEEKYNLDRATGHAMSFKAAVAATCTQDGHEAYYECSGCKKLFKDNNGLVETTLAAVKLDKHGVTYHAGKAAVSCSEPGYHEYWHCAVCDKDFFDEACTREVSASDPNTIVIAHEVSASFVNAGATGHKKVCANCQQPFGEGISHVKDSYSWACDEKTHWHSCKAQGCDFKFDEAKHDYVSYGSDQVCSVCGHVKGGQESGQQGGFDIKAGELTPHGTLSAKVVSGSQSGALSSGARYKATFTLDAGCEITAIGWYLDGKPLSMVELAEGSGEDALSYVFDTPASRTYKIMCVVYNGKAVMSYEIAVFGGN